MTTFIFANNVNTTLAGAVSNSATSITLSSTANLPSSIPSGSVLVITLNDVATKANFEIVYATAITGATLTVLRGQEGTSALAWLTGDFAFSPPTAGQMLAMGQLSATNTWVGANTFDSPVAVGAAIIPGQAITLGQANATFAQLAGSSGQVFNVANATSNSQALPLGQLPSQFPSSLGGNGYKKYPDSNSPTGFFIEQWGAFNAITSSQAMTLPIAFPNVFLQVNATDVGANCFAYGAAPVNNSQFNLFISTTAVHSGTWIARGY
jgi:hypothetical protein